MDIVFDFSYVYEFALAFVLSALPPLGFAIIFNAPRKELLHCTMTGAIGWLVYYIASMFSLGVGIPTFLGAMALSIFARIFSYTRRAPSTLYLIPGIIPLVPGARVYNTMKAILDGSMYSFYVEGAAALKIAGAIALGIILIFTLPYKAFEFVKPKDLRK